jgi:synaptobrevin homolog YKT6
MASSSSSSLSPSEAKEQLKAKDNSSKLWAVVIFSRSEGAYKEDPDAANVKKKVREWSGGVRVCHVSSAFNISSVSRMARASVKSFMVFTAREMTRRVLRDRLTVIVHDGQHCFVANEGDGLCACVVAGELYPQRYALLLATKCAEAVRGSMEASAWLDAQKDAKLECAQLAQLIAQFADVDKLSRVAAIRRQVDTVHEQAVLNLTEVLARGERLDALVKQADELDSTTKTLYKDTKKLKKCGMASCAIS